MPATLVMIGPISMARRSQVGPVQARIVDYVAWSISACAGMPSSAKQVSGLASLYVRRKTESTRQCVEGGGRKAGDEQLAILSTRLSSGTISRPGEEAGC